MKRSLVVLFLIVACGGERESTNTIAPADPMPGPQTTSVGEVPVVTTAGSPRPAEALPPGTYVVTITDDGIAMRTQIPLGYAALRIRNATALPHRLELRGEDAAAAVDVPPNGTAVLQQVVRARRYDVVCVTPGHHERSSFQTYDPGSPLNVGTR